VVAAHEAIGVDVDALGDGVRAALIVDLDAAGEVAGVVAQGDGLADQRGVDLEDDAVETDGAVLLDLALLLEEEEVGEVLRGERDVRRRARPLLAGRGVVQAAVGRVEVLVLDPGPEPLIEGVQRLGVGPSSVGSSCNRTVRNQRSSLPRPCGRKGRRG
jgi:hypothetical protein